MFAQGLIAQASPSFAPPSQVECHKLNGAGIIRPGLTQSRPASGALRGCPNRCPHSGVDGGKRIVCSQATHRTRSAAVGTRGFTTFGRPAIPVKATCGVLLLSVDGYGYLRFWRENEQLEALCCVRYLLLPSLFWRLLCGGFVRVFIDQIRQVFRRCRCPKMKQELYDTKDQ